MAIATGFPACAPSVSSSGDDDDGDPSSDPARGAGAGGSRGGPGPSGGSGGAGAGTASDAARGDALASGERGSEPPTGGSTDGRPSDLGAAAGGDAGRPATFDSSPNNAPLGALPVVLLEVPGRTPDTIPNPGATKIAGTIKVIEDHDGTHTNVMSRPIAFQSTIGISRRGSSSNGFPQKSFAIEFRDGAGVEVKRPVLGMPAEADWAAVACWTDKTCMRNALAYTIGQGFGRWAPRFRFVEVFFNGSYQGLYLFAEPPRQDRNRVAIPKPAPDMAGGDAFTGGYIIRREAGGKGGIRDWLSPTTAPGMWPHQIVYTYHYPRETDITAAQKTYIQGHVARFEEAMKASDWAARYKDWIDATAWADFVIINELTNNVDGYWKSFYVAKLPDQAGVRGKMLATPPWDFNIGFGNANYRSGWRTDVLNFTGLTTFGGECAGPVTKGPPLCDGVCCVSAAMNTCRTRCWNMPIVPFYWERLQSDTAFRSTVKCRWQNLRKTGGPIDMAVIDGWIAGWKRELERFAIARHFAKWPALRMYVWPNPYMVDTSSAPVAGASVQQFFDKEVMWFRSWVDRRARWLDSGLPGTCTP